jgi:hypothetical protein
MMALTRKSLIVPLTAMFTCASLLTAGEKERPKFTPQPATSYDTRLTISNVTVAAVPYAAEGLVVQAFGKVNPNREGVLPVLVVIQNDSGQTLALDRLKVELVTADRERVPATPAADLKYLGGAERPKVYTGPLPGSPHISKKKNPLAAWEIEGRAFSARVLAPKDSANGFFYFRAAYYPGATLYITGLREAASGKELFYFEIPLEKRDTTELPVERRTAPPPRGMEPPLGIPGRLPASML